MGWLSIVIGIVAAIALRQAGAGLLFWVAVVTTGVAFWSWGIMHNFAMEAAKNRPTFRGGFYDITPREADTAPNWVTSVNLLATIGCIGLLVVGIIKLI